MAFSGSLTTYVIIVIVIVLVGTGIYIGRLLYKDRVRRKDIENGGRIKILERELELEPLPYEEEEKLLEILQSLKTDSKDSKSSLENSTNTSSSREKERKSSSYNSNSRRKTSASFNNNKIVRSRPRSFQNSKNGSLNGSRNGSRNSSRNGSRNVSRNGSRNVSRNGSRNESRNGSRYGTRSDSSINSSLFIKISKNIPPPPPPSPLKPPDNSIESLLIIIPSDISEQTYTPMMPSNASSSILSRTQSKSSLKAQSLTHFQPTSHDNNEFEKIKVKVGSNN